jgi:hypothetical protein
MRPEKLERKERRGDGEENLDYLRQERERETDRLTGKGRRALHKYNQSGEDMLPNSRQ